MNSNLRALSKLTLLIILFCPARAQSGSGRDETALRAIEQGLARAYVKGDRAFVERVLDSEWTVIDAGGRVLDKAQVLRETFESTERRVESARIDRVRVRIYGDSAIVTGRSWARGSYRGQKMEATFLFTDLFVRRNRQWKVVSSQATLLPD
jgi:uncharacterized protein DUF4440